jgi:hypothetical protein
MTAEIFNGLMALAGVILGVGLATLYLWFKP